MKQKKAKKRRTGEGFSRSQGKCMQSSCLHPRSPSIFTPPARPAFATQSPGNCQQLCQCGSTSVTRKRHRAAAAGVLGKGKGSIRRDSRENVCGSSHSTLPVSCWVLSTCWQQWWWWRWWWCLFCPLAPLRWTYFPRAQAPLFALFALFALSFRLMLTMHDKSALEAYVSVCFVSVGGWQCVRVCVCLWLPTSGGHLRPCPKAPHPCIPASLGPRQQLWAWSAWLAAFSMSQRFVANCHTHTRGRGGCGGCCHLGSVVAFNYACLRAKVYFVSPSHTEKAWVRETARRHKGKETEAATAAERCTCNVWPEVCLFDFIKHAPSAL